VSGVRLHGDEPELTVALVRALLRAQHPAWAELPIEPVDAAGTEHASFRLGSRMVLRIPRTATAARRLEKEWTWLPRLAPTLPLEVPAPLARGSPGEGLPWSWAVYRWIDGRPAAFRDLTDPVHAAVTLATFVAAMGRIVATDGPPPGEHNFGRGAPLRTRDEATRRAVAELRAEIDESRVLRAWERASSAPTPESAPTWIHGDLLPGNILVRAGAVSAVIDFGGLGVGDPACDLIVAWSLLRGRSRAAFRAALAVDDATWERGRGWALSIGLIAAPYYEHTRPEFASMALGMVREALTEVT
jgi:aminoglycoside phosphotransferase (APT) family kinase protein